MKPRPFPSRHALAGLMLLGLTASGCGNSSGSTGTQPLDGGSSTDDRDAMLMDGMDPDATVSCQNDPRVTAYQDGLTLTGQAGAVHVKWIGAEPSPPAKGENSWDIQLLDRSDDPLGGAIAIGLDMPDHGHSSPQTPVVMPGASNGAYSITNLDLFMPAVWRIQISVYANDAADAAAPLDIVTFFLCIEG